MKYLHHKKITYTHTNFIWYRIKTINLISVTSKLIPRPFTCKAASCRVQSNTWLIYILRKIDKELFGAARWYRPIGAPKIVSNRPQRRAALIYNSSPRHLRARIVCVQIARGRVLFSIYPALGPSVTHSLSILSRRRADTMCPWRNSISKQQASSCPGEKNIGSFTRTREPQCVIVVVSMTALSCQDSLRKLGKTVCSL